MLPLSIDYIINYSLQEFTHVLKYTFCPIKYFSGLCIVPIYYYFFFLVVQQDSYQDPTSPPPLSLTIISTNVLTKYSYLFTKKIVYESINGFTLISHEDRFVTYHASN